MSKEIVVDREMLQVQMLDLLDLFNCMENGGKYYVTNDGFAITSNGYEQKKIEYLDLDAVHAKYSGVDLEIQTIGGITFVSSDKFVLECGILKDTSNIKANTVVTEVIFGVTQWGVEVYDEDNNVKHNYTNYSGILNNVVNILRFTSGVNKSFANNGVNYDAVIDMGVKTSGLLGEYSIGLFSNMTMRDFVKKILTLGAIELEAGIPFTIAEPEGDDVKIAWSDGQPVIGVTSNNSSVTDFITGVQNQLVLGLYNFYKRYLSRELFAQFELDSNIYVDGETVVKAQNKIVA